MVTRGSNGSLLFREPSDFTACPALAVKIVDRVGAGDAVLAVTSLLAAKETPADFLSMVGNFVGAEAVTIVGNKEAIEKTQLLDNFLSFLGKIESI
jgi:sugar/nucleoside kinase (ribokinase family)